MQRHMDHFREATLWCDDQLMLEGVEGYLGFRERPGRRKEWHGYFLVGAEHHLNPELRYTLTLSDGTSATIRGSDITACEADGGKRHAVEFYVIGEFRSTGGRLGSLLASSRRRLST